MCEPSVCLGHGVRDARRNKISRLLTSPHQSLDENLRVMVNKGLVAVETSLKELEENYARKPGLKVIEEGGVLNVSVKKFRMINLSKPDRAGHVAFGRHKGGGKQIGSYPNFHKDKC